MAWCGAKGDGAQRVEERRNVDGGRRAALQQCTLSMVFWENLDRPGDDADVGNKEVILW
ncbi:putative lipid II flippase FtsW [Sesbania bispinosa]|nr:putative lipid II flippase FtsW [Sesbania bispinosa]